MKSKLRYLKALFLLPMLAVLGCPSQQTGACRAGLNDKPLVRWEAKQDVKWNRFMRTMQHRFEAQDNS